MELEIGTAVLRTAVPSLVKLLQFEWGLDKKVKHGLMNLEAELRSMDAFLEDVSRMPPDQHPTRQLKVWADEVRELWYAIEKHLHSFMARIESTKSTRLSAISKLKINHDIASYIEETRIKVKEVRERYGTYPLKIPLESTSTQKVDPRIFALYTKESDLVGLAGATDELTKMLSKGDHVSIVGIGGLGKTTLARAVSENMKDKFEICVFVPVGRSSDVKKVLKDILRELHTDICGDAPEEMQLIDQVRNSLVNKRCLFVIDDIWNKETWALIICAFEGSAKCKIITTTRKHKVAEAVGCVYVMKPLSDANSKELLHKKIFGAEAKSHDTEFARLSDKFLSKCSGVPIAIIMIASLLSKKPREEWSMVYDSIGFDRHPKDGVVKDMRMILSYSYYDLPYHLKRCFLYLSIFPEDHWIEKNMLIWRWVAEGLVSGPNDQRLGLFELRETYFNELIERSMIQRAVSPRDLGQGGFHVHDMMVDLIRGLSSSENENFSTVLDRKWESSSSSTIHRLAIHRTSVDQIPNTSLEVGEVLSFYASRCLGSSLPKLSKFARLRVIDLEGCDLSVGDCKLKHLGGLDELEYIGLLGTSLAELPKKIRHLKFLQVLDVTGTGIRELPPFIEELKKLRCLRAGKGTKMMGRAGKLTSLEELWLHSADKSPEFAADLKKLTELRILVIHFDKMDQVLNEVLVKSLSSLKKLQVLQFWSDEEEMICLSGWEGNIPSPHLCQLLLFRVSLPSLPSWIHCSCVPKLSKLLLQVETLEAQHLEILGQMSSLRSIYLHSKDNHLSYMAGRDEFRVLEYLNTNIELVCGDGALPRIQELDIGCIRVGTDVGLQGNMPLLERANYHLDCIHFSLVEIEKAEAKLRQASQAHPNHPTISIKRFNNYKIQLEEQHRSIESLAPELMRELLLVFSGPGSITGLGGGSEAQANVFVDMIDIIAGFRSAVGDPPILTMGDATDDTGSPSQSADGVPPRRPNGEGHVLLTANSTFQSAKHKVPFSTGELLANLKGQSAENVVSTLAKLAGTEPAVVMGMLEKWSRNPELIARMNSMEWDAKGSRSPSDISTLLHFIMPDVISQLGWPGRGSGTSALDSTTLNKELGNDNFKFDADSLLDRVDSLIAENAVPGITAKDAAGDARKSLNKSMQNPETVASMYSMQNAGGPDTSKLGKPMMADFIGAMDKRTDGPGNGQGAESNLAGKHPAENSGAGVSPESLSTVFQSDTVLSWFNTPDGADFLSERAAASFGMSPVAYRKLAEKHIQKPETIASFNRSWQTGDFSGMDELLMRQMIPDIVDHFFGFHSNLAVGSQRVDPTAQLASSMDSAASTSASAAPCSSQDGDILSNSWAVQVQQTRGWPACSTQITGEKEP